MLERRRAQLLVLGCQLLGRAVPVDAVIDQLIEDVLELGLQRDPPRFVRLAIGRAICAASSGICRTIHLQQKKMARNGRDKTIVIERTCENNRQELV